MFPVFCFDAVLPLNFIIFCITKERVFLGLLKYTVVWQLYAKTTCIDKTRIIVVRMRLC